VSHRRQPVPRPAWPGHSAGGVRAGGGPPDRHCRCWRRTALLWALLWALPGPGAAPRGRLGAGSGPACSAARRRAVHGVVIAAVDGLWPFVAGVQLLPSPSSVAGREGAAVLSWSRCQGEPGDPRFDPASLFLGAFLTFLRHEASGCCFLHAASLRQSAAAMRAAPPAATLHAALGAAARATPQAPWGGADAAAEGAAACCSPHPAALPAPCSALLCLP
jgi:hypothetical protein